IEAPAPDAIDQIKSQGFHLYANTQPHLWPWQFTFEKGSPWQDIRVRKAANLCLNRAELKSYLGSYMTEATGVYEADSLWHGKPTFQIKYDPDAARQLMTEAGYSAGKPLHVTVATSASGSGQMQPLPMNEYIQH
ncbi:ABC transporter substrate-binding protein, partial [Klebsiella pneumoniae]|uniref:ABC transporter substrate-binding protein n=1 Tax=Klebsiella pneumoniae TaxID=573 RepID=UPI0013C8FC5D